eukprot:TRINITY_DN2167_c0_g1_i1.p1 TRINITY_DN2167_c0_g1~~TRINITY_DN2167_c0_g1_i1.p1  ORF type:complete len:184 (-),score=29.49 TRINITY_DN2167_c0_g1_i1:279-788(-)
MCTPLSTNPSATPQYNESFTASQYKEPLTIPQYTESPHQSQNPPKDDFDIQESCNQSVSSLVEKTFQKSPQENVKDEEEECHDESEDFQLQDGSFQPNETSKEFKNDVALFNIVYGKDIMCMYKKPILPFQHMLIFIFLRESFEGQKTLKFKLSPHSCALGHSLYLQSV